MSVESSLSRFSESLRFRYWPRSPTYMPFLSPYSASAMIPLPLVFSGTNVPLSPAVLPTPYMSRFTSAVPNAVAKRYLSSFRYNLAPIATARLPLFVNTPPMPTVDGGEISSFLFRGKTRAAAHSSPEPIAGLLIGIGANSHDPFLSEGGLTLLAFVPSFCFSLAGGPGVGDC